MLKYQRGVSLSGLLVWSVILVLVAGVGMKVVPSVIEYFKIVKDTKSAVAQVGKDATVADVKKSFEKYADIDQLDFTADQLDISKDGGNIVISFDYDKKIPLFGNVSLLINYKGSTAK